MDQWIPAPDFIEADVIRWTEAVWDKRRRSKPLRIGERQIVGEVLSRGEDGWVAVLVRSCVVTKDEFAGRVIEVFKPLSRLRRGLKTILRGKSERLPWDDESARAEVVASKPVKSRFGGSFNE